MNILSHFRQADFPEQISLLTKIQEEKIREATEDLFDLYAKPLKDTMVDHLVTTTLRSLLAGDEIQTVRRLQKGDRREKALCVIVAGNNRFASAVPVLETMLDQSEFTDLHSECLFALGEIKAPPSLRIFRQRISDPNEMIASLAIQMIGQYADEDSVDALLFFLEAAEKTENYESCSLRTGMAVEALAAIKTPASLCGLIAHLHHRNATVRRLIGDALVKTGSSAVALLASVFDTDDDDVKVLAANILGFIGDKVGGEMMVRALDAGKTDHPNVRFAVYEAFGKISFLKGLTCLVDALSEEDDLILMAVVTALDARISSGVIARLKKELAGSHPHSDKLIRILVAAKASHLFEAMHTEPGIASRMIARIRESADPDVRHTFKTALAGMTGERAAADLALLTLTDTIPAGRDILAVDDSKAMLSFYRNIVSEMGLKIQTAENGKAALTLIDAGQSFDLIIADMNMPVMDGLELTRKIRQKPALSQTPILMATTESESAQRIMAQSAGVDAFVIKPFTAVVLKNKVAALLAPPPVKQENTP